METSSLKPLFEGRGPFASVHVDVSRNGSDPTGQIEARWTAIRHELERQGVDEQVREEIGRRIREPSHLPGTVHRTVIARDGEIVMDEVRAGGTTWPEDVCVGPLPDLAGWLSQAAEEVPFLLAEVDRAGADLHAYLGQGRPPVAEDEVQGETWELTKLPEGDWAQDRYQRRAESSWRANAGLVADAIEHLRKRFRPRVVAIAGDVRARAELIEAIGPPSEADDLVVVELPGGGRAAGSSEETEWAEVDEVLTAVAARDEHDVLERLQRGLAGVEPAAFGLEPVAEAIARAEVDTLVLDLGQAREQTIDAARFPGLPVGEYVAGAGPLPADQVLIASTVLTGGQVDLVSSGTVPRGDGIAATLRW
jgi:hypothetical protein